LRREDKGRGFLLRVKEILLRGKEVLLRERMFY